MDAVLRATAVYFFLLVVIRISGRRTLGEMTTFDLILVLIIAETTQQALLGEDLSLTNAFLLITTLVTIDIGISLVKRRSRAVDDRLIDGVPMIFVGRRPAASGAAAHEQDRRARCTIGRAPPRGAREHWNRSSMLSLRQMEQSASCRDGGRLPSRPEAGSRNGVVRSADRLKYVP